jgi:hypothetical protein
LAVPVLLGMAFNGMLCSVYMPQLSQLLVLQLEQELPPTGELIPFSSLERQAKLDKTFSARLLQCGHKASSSTWFIRRNNSNLDLHLEQTYSYNGIYFYLL